MKTHYGLVRERRNETYLLISRRQMQRAFDCRDFAGCLDAPELIPAGADHQLLSREVPA